MNERIFNQSIETEDGGMAGGRTWYDIEDLYQAFKERLAKESNDDARLEHTEK